MAGINSLQSYGAGAQVAMKCCIHGSKMFIWSTPCPRATSIMASLMLELKGAMASHEHLEWGQTKANNTGLKHGGLAAEDQRCHGLES